MLFIHNFPQSPTLKDLNYFLKSTLFCVQIIYIPNSAVWPYKHSCRQGGAEHPFTILHSLNMAAISACLTRSLGRAAGWVSSPACGTAVNQRAFLFSLSECVSLLFLLFSPTVFLPQVRQAKDFLMLKSWKVTPSLSGDLFQCSSDGKFSQPFNLSACFRHI